MRVLLTLYRDDPRVGGAWRVTEILGAALPAEGVQTHVCFAYGPPGPIGARLGSRCHYLGLERAIEVAAWPRYRKVLGDLRPDIVHYVEPVFWMHAAAAGIDYREIVHVHTTFWERQRLRDLVGWRLLKRRADLFVCISEAARQSTIDRGFSRPDQAVVVYNAIDVEWFQRLPDPRAARRALGVPADRTVIGMACRLVPWKGCDDLLRVLALLPADWHVLLAGDGPDRARLERLAAMLCVSDRVTFTGNLNDVRLAYAAMDAFALMSVNEPFGLVIAEAMAARVPVFGLGGAGEYRERARPLVTPDNAVLVERKTRRAAAEPEDPAVLKALAERFLVFGKRPAMHLGMVERAWTHVRAHFAMESQAREMAAVYRTLVPTAGAAAPAGAASAAPAAGA
jgi:glycosyltransferase involved in cell wall biosynthesis